MYQIAFCGVKRVCVGFIKHIFAQRFALNLPHLRLPQGVCLLRLTNGFDLRQLVNRRLDLGHPNPLRDHLVYTVHVVSLDKRRTARGKHKIAGVSCKSIKKLLLLVNVVRGLNHLPTHFENQDNQMFVPALHLKYRLRLLDQRP
jgi:hypothetical protein